ncbi:uncharacterized protein EAF01_001303 [Botrytis porri]|uniref:uncharacterized protein n=1 Tax=Botrytis porri TaxID=87229 RepID=UPI00190287D2|nr:uncharacterized protein EAF01_001303 [Botrytis porri]KAF7912282.1 hypothetical protein EAF01_001303 [Botrytis porri]
MGNWKFIETVSMEPDSSEVNMGLIMMSTREGFRNIFCNKLAEVIKTSYQPMGDEKKPSDKAINGACDIISKYVHAWVMVYERRQSTESIEWLTREEQYQLQSQLQSTYIHGSAERVQHIEVAQELFDPLLKFATKASLKDFATFFSESIAYDRDHARASLDNLTRRDVIHEEDAKKIKSTLNTDYKAWLFMEFHNTADFAALIDNEIARLNIFRVLEEENVATNALLRTIYQIYKCDTAGRQEAIGQEGLSRGWTRDTGSI